MKKTKTGETAPGGKTRTLIQKKLELVKKYRELQDMQKFRDVRGSGKFPSSGRNFNQNQRSNNRSGL